MNEFLEQLNQFHFLRPIWLLGLAPAAAIIALLWNRKASYGSWQRVISPHLLPHLLGNHQVRKNKLPLIMLAICWVLACIAMAGPTWRTMPQAVQKKVDGQVIVLDLSLSMYAQDLAPSRVMRARMKLTDILKRSDEGLTALVVYAGTPHVVTPLTDDSNTILSMVNSLSPDIMPVKGSDPVDAIKRAMDVFKLGGLDGGRILLMTDSLPENFVNKIKPHFNYRYQLSILGIGTKNGAPISLPDGSFVKRGDGSIVMPKLNSGTLKQAAKQLNGRYTTMTADDQDINYLLAKDTLIQGDEIKETGREFDVWEESGHWLVLLIPPFAAAAYRKGWLGSFAIYLGLGTALLAFPSKSQAFEWQDLWSRPDQRASQLLEQGNPKAAAETFKDPHWKASSHYLAEEFEQAEALFSQDTDPDSLYNLGNTQAKLGKYDQAIESYEKALQQQPNMADAQHNLELVKKLQEQQQKDQNQDSENQDQQDSENQDKENQNQENQDKEQEQNQQDSDSDKNEDNQDQQDSESDQDKQQDQNKSSEDEQQEPPQDQQSNQATDDEESEDQEPEQANAAQEQAAAPTTEEKQALDQWLRRIPDDPGGLLRRKFEQESQLRDNAPRGEAIW